MFTFTDLIFTSVFSNALDFGNGCAVVVTNLERAWQNPTCWDLNVWPFILFYLCVCVIGLLRSAKIFPTIMALSWPSRHGATAITEIKLGSQKGSVSFFQCKCLVTSEAFSVGASCIRLVHSGAHAVVKTVASVPHWEGQCLCAQPLYSIPQANTVIWSEARPLPICTLVCLQTWAAVWRISSWTQHK